MEFLFGFFLFCLGVSWGVFLSNSGASKMHEKLRIAEAEIQHLRRLDAINRQAFESMNHQYMKQKQRPAFEIFLGLTRPYTKEDVNRAYREKAKKYHPDMGGSSADMMALNGARQMAMNAAQR